LASRRLRAGVFVAGHIGTGAAQACGPLAVSVTCTSAGNNYPGGISYLQTTPATDLHVTLDSNVNVTFSGAQLGAVMSTIEGVTLN